MHRRQAVSAIAVSALLAGTLVAAWLTHRQTDDRHDSALSYEAARLDDAIRQRMSAYVQVLRGGAGLFDASDRVTRSEWIAYVDSLRVRRRYPGFKSLTFARAVPDAQLGAFVAAERRQLPGYTLRSPVAGVTTNPALHSPIVYVAPDTPRNTRVLGVDMMQEPERREAMEASVAADDAVLSPRLALAGQDDHQAGFIAFLPVRDDGHLEGWLTAAFLAPDFFRGLVGTGDPKVAFEIRDGGGRLLWSTERPRPDGAPRDLVSDDRPDTKTIDLPGQSWQMRYVATPALESGADRALPWLILFGGLLMSGLFGIVVVTNQRANATIHHRAMHDALTGICNRAGFEEHLEAAIATGAPFALAYLDLDRFKPVNDEFGHATGDELLCATARRVRGRVRMSDTVARMGGDEFAVLLRSPDRAESFAADVATHLATPFRLEQATVEISVSVGVAVFPEDGTTAAGLLEAADLAMYASKARV